jgi:hypothetical protein
MLRVRPNPCHIFTHSLGTQHRFVVPSIGPEWKCIALGRVTLKPYMPLRWFADKPSSSVLVAANSGLKRLT